MEIKPVPFAPDVQYFLDCALDVDEITPFTHATLSLFGDHRNVTEIIDRKETGRGWRWQRGQKCVDLDAHAHEVVANVDESIKRALFASMLLREPAMIKGVAEELASWRYEDATVGGALQPFRKHHRCNADYEAAGGLARHLAAPSAIRRYVKHDPECVPFRRLFRDRLRTLPWPSTLREADILTPYFEAQHASFKEARRRAYQRLFANPVEILPPSRADRKRMLRSLSAAQAVIGHNNASAFARGDKVTIIDGDILFEVRRSLGLLALGHGGMHIAIAYVGGEKLANLCLYFDRTPPLDQVAALALHIRAGEGTALIKTGNLFNVTPAGAAHPLIADRLAERDIGGRFRPDRFDLQRQAQDRHFQRSGHYYVEAVEVRLWGRDVRRVCDLTRELSERKAA